jgi:hypothetical protein
MATDYVDSMAEPLKISNGIAVPMGTSQTKLQQLAGGLEVFTLF